MIGHDEDLRHGQRSSVLKAGRIVFGNTVLDCLVLDISPTGARVRFGMPMAIPESVVLRLREGASYPAVRRWSRGTEVGLEFSGPPIIERSEAQSRHAAAALDLLHSASLAGCLDLLQRERFFGNEGLRHAAEAARDAYASLETILRTHAVKTARPAAPTDL